MPSVKLIVNSAESCVRACVFYKQKVRLVMFYASYFFNKSVEKTTKAFLAMIIFVPNVLNMM